MINSIFDSLVRLSCRNHDFSISDKVPWYGSRCADVNRHAHFLPWNQGGYHDYFERAGRLERHRHATFIPCVHGRDASAQPDIRVRVIPELLGGTFRIIHFAKCITTSIGFLDCIYLLKVTFTIVQQ